jgi:hypothetical protein
MSETSKSAVLALLEGLDESEALSVFWTLQSQFGWSGTVFTRADAEQEWQNAQYDDTTGETGGDELPEAMWEAVQDSWYWRKGLPELMTERGWGLVGQAVMDAIEAVEFDRTVYTVMPEADRIPHACFDHPDYEGTLMNGCAGCEQAAAHPCKWCGYGGAFATHAPEAHMNNGDPNVTDVNDVAGYGDEWCDFPHLYGKEGK